MLYKLTKEITMDGYQLRTYQKRTDILNATRQLILTKHLNKITILDIAKLAHVSHVTIYKLFNNKETLVIAALKNLSYDNVNNILHVLSSDDTFLNRLEGYFRTSFASTKTYKDVDLINAYMFSGEHLELKHYVLSLYDMTIPGFKRLYEDGRNLNLIRASITFEIFLNMLDMYVHIPPKFYQDPHKLNVLIESFIISFR